MRPACAATCWAFCQSRTRKLEEAYLDRAEVWEHLRGIEDDLLDDHVVGQRAASEKAAFEGRYLSSPVLRERVMAARALRVSLP